MFGALELPPFVVWFELNWLMPRPHRALTVVIWIGGVVNALLMLVHVRFAFRAAGSPSVLPLLRDEDLLAKIADIAAAYGLRVPRVRVLSTFGGIGDTMAMVGGLIAPSVLVTDGLRQRLSAAEQEAILANELGHVANHTL